MSTDMDTQIAEAIRKGCQCPACAPFDTHLKHRSDCGVHGDPTWECDCEQGRMVRAEIEDEADRDAELNDRFDAATPEGGQHG